MKTSPATNRKKIVAQVKSRSEQITGIKAARMPQKMK
jgi:hypothetical protein